jgi:cell division septation protein DedD
MLKYAAILFNTIALLIYQFFFADGITITQNIPTSAKADTEFTVELTINKGTTGGFAKLQQDLPEGFTAVQDDNNGASFTFTNQAVKFIWMSLPAEKEFKIKYKIKVAAGISGDKIIAGKFSYVSDNVKQSVEIAPSTIKIGDGSAQPIVTNTPTTSSVPTTTTPTTTTPVKTQTPTTTEPVAATTTPTTTASTTTSDNSSSNNLTTQLLDKSASSAPAEPSSVICTRNTPSNPTGNFTVEIIVNKGNATGFAKLLETLPAGFTATAGETQGASFSFADQKVKFVWVSMPSLTEFKVSYKVAIASSVSGTQPIDGVFSYIENDATKKFMIPTSNINVGGSAAAEPVVTNTTPDNSTTKTPTTTTTPVSTTPTKTTTTEPVVATTTPVTTTPTTTTPTKTRTTETPSNTTTASTTTTKSLAATTIPTPQGNVKYSVQIAALRRSVDASVLATRYNINSPINTEMAQGLTKYVVGAHSDYKTARDARENIKNKGVVGPFVTAYNGGQRITVQEAIMITSQQWFR